MGPFWKLILSKQENCRDPDEHVIWPLNGRLATNNGWSPDGDCFPVSSVKSSSHTTPRGYLTAVFRNVRARPVHSDKLTRLKEQKACWFLWQMLSINLKRRQPLLPNVDAVRGAPTPPNRNNTGLTKLQFGSTVMRNTRHGTPNGVPT